MSVSSSAVDGLVSGLDTTSIIAKLMAVDAAPQTALKKVVTTDNAKVSAYQMINAKIVGLQGAADALQSAGTWSSTQATSSDASISVTAGPTATPGSLSVTVNALATGKTVVSGSDITVNSDGVVIGSGGTRDDSQIPVPIDIVRSDGSYVTIQPASGKLSEVVDAINKAGTLGVSAVAIRVGENKFRLQITSTTTGLTAGDFKIVAHTTGANPDTGATVPVSDPSGSKGYPFGSTKTYSTAAPAGAFTTATSPVDAKITMGPGAGFSLTSSSNTFADVMSGVSLTVSQVTPNGGAPATVSVSSNPGAIATAVQGLVDAANAALSALASQSKAGVVGADGNISGAGLLRGDSALKNLRSQIISAVTTGLGAGSVSAASLGVQSTRDGNLTFDKAKFLTTYASNPATTEQLVSSVAAGTAVKNPDGTTTSASDGLVERLRRVTVQAIGDVKASPTTASGILTSAITGQNKAITELTSRIADWDTRLAQKQQRYTKYYASLEVALGTLKNQSTWLSGQLAGLNSSSS
ncbi:flagellar filament capping protein FliD [Kineococcus sp. GCM10028916]|uniref:flagellar filament capping protein FliD n=1 Tax=Kineococcus sp. GCM10028916 TaxID=3273394 RepID=UPI0036270A46